MEDWIVPAPVDSAILNSIATNVNSLKFGLSQDPGDDQKLKTFLDNFKMTKDIIF